MKAQILLLSLVIAVGCGGDDRRRDETRGGPRDAGPGTTVDAGGPMDASARRDGSAPNADAGGPDATVETDASARVDGGGMMMAADAGVDPARCLSGTGPCDVENSNYACSDGVDNDGNGAIDCDDPECARRFVCQGESTNARCSDGVDNDGDLQADCFDADCQGEAIVVCDGDRPVTPANLESAIGARCTNGIDDDLNEFPDCADRTCDLFHEPCRSKGRERGNRACSDGVDNDADGAVDCGDPQCRGEGVVVCNGTTPVSFPSDSALTAAANAACSNGDDDDLNRFADCEDFNCAHDDLVRVCDATSQGNARTCSDGMSNGDRFTDCEAFECTRDSDRTDLCVAREKDTVECGNGLDDDANGFADCDDLQCRSRPACF